MEAELVQAGERLVVRSSVAWVSDVFSEAGGSAWQAVRGHPADVELVVERSTTPFGLAGWEPLTRGAYRRSGQCVVRNACGSGFDLLVDADAPEAGGQVRVVARWCPPRRERVATLLLRARFLLLTRAVLMQYPALWRAGLRGRVPLHASAVAFAGRVPLLVGPGGCGRTTMLLAAAARGGRACSDNLVAGDERGVHGVVEPVRADGGSGRRMTHGRREQQLPGRVSDLVPDRIVVLRRGVGSEVTAVAVPPDRAARVLTAGTFMAGELRRYWPFAATLALGTGLGPAHPPVAGVAEALAARLPATEVTLATRRTGDPSDVLSQPLVTGVAA